MAKIIGYILAIISVILIIFSSKIQTLKGFTALKPMYIIVFAIVLAIIGIFFVMQSGTSKGKQASREVPIYHGKKIVGYRRK